MLAAARQQVLPTGRSKRIGPGGCVVGTGAVERGDCPAHGRAMLQSDAARPDARQKGGDGRGAAAQVSQRCAVAPHDRPGAGDAAIRQVFHQAQEVRQVSGFDALFVQGQYEVAGGGAQREVAVLHALGDALAGHGAADVVFGQEVVQRIVGNLGVHGHRANFWHRMAGSP